MENFYRNGVLMNLRNSKVYFSIIFGLIIFLVFQQELKAQAGSTSNSNEVINFSGIITDSNNLVADGEYSILFSLYNNQEDSSPVWSELHKNVIVQNGEINVQLGNAAIPNPIKIPFDKVYYLGIKINNDAEMNPRIELLPVPYSIRTNIAANVKDNSITSNKIAPLSITDDKIKSISWNKIKVSTIPEIKSVKSLADINSQNSITELTHYWRRKGNELPTGDEYLGTMNDRNLMIRTDSVQRMLFTPDAKVFMGTAEDSVFFEVIGKTTLGNVYVKNRMGVGADFPDTKAKLHIKTNGKYPIPFRVDNDSVKWFTIESNGRVEITSPLAGAEDSEDGYPLFINSVDQGMAININGSSNSSHNYMSFFDDDGIAGRIEGMDFLDYSTDPKIIAHTIWFEAQNVALLVAVAASATGDLELPDAINGVAEIAYWVFQTGWDLGHLGVAYKSSHADYAEWLQKINTDEPFSYGDIVGVYGGKISKNTSSAEQIMSISSSPIVLGNMSEKGKESNYQKVAFKGQVPVKVKGIVHKGDYIIPSGLNDGIGIAVQPDLMTAEEFAKVVGRAWQSNEFDDVRFINVAVGLKMKDLARCIKQSFSSNNRLANQLEEKNRELDSILSQLDEMDSALKSVQVKSATKSKAKEKSVMYSVNKKINRKK
jgi:hypothetical protein